MADWFPRAAVLVVSHLGACATQSTVATLLLTRHYHLTVICALEAANGICAALTTPAPRGVLPQLVARNSLQRANSALATSRNACKVLGPTLAGGVVALAGGGWAIAVEALSFALAALCLARLRVPVESRPSRASVGPQSLWFDLREGWSQFRALPWVVVIVAAFAGSNFVLGGVWLVLGPWIAQATIGAPGWGLVLSARAIGLLAMGAAMYRLRPSHPLRWSQVGAALYAVPFVALGVAPSMPWLAGAAALAGAGAAVTGISWETALTEHVPNRALSRVAAYDDLGSYATVPLGQLATVPLASALGAPHVAVLGGVLYAALTLGPLAVPAVRNLRRAT